MAIVVGEGVLHGEARTVSSAAIALGAALVHVTRCRVDVADLGVTPTLPSATERLIGSLEQILRQNLETADQMARLLDAGGGTYDAAELAATG